MLSIVASTAVALTALAQLSIKWRRSFPALRPCGLILLPTSPMR